jgi:hypothetical protein
LEVEHFDMSCVSFTFALSCNNTMLLAHHGAINVSNAMRLFSVESAASPVAKCGGMNASWLRVQWSVQQKT